ncbi:hypothetical protein OQA88_11842 [Cercophora sp. LCS_1]
MSNFMANNSYSGILAIFAVALIVVHGYRTLRRPTSQLPGPWITKWTDAVTLYYWLTGRKAKYVHSLHQKYGKDTGPVVRLGPNEVDISDRNVTKEIYSVKAVYRKDPFYMRFIAKGVDNVFSVNDTDVHRRYRRLLSNPMSESALKTVHGVIEANVDLAIRRVREEVETRGAADIFKWWMFMATDIIGELSFGQSFRMLEQKKKNQYILDLERAGFVSAMRATFPTLITYPWLFPLPIFRRAASATARMVRYAEESLARHQRLELADPTNAKTTLFSKIFQAESEEQLSFQETRNNAMAYIIAGSDTTANTLTYLVWSVCKHPHVKAALVAELNTLPTSGFGNSKLKQLPYLNQVVEETLRLYAAAPSSLPRSVPPEGAVLAGYWLEGGTTVSSQAYTLHRDPETFPDPELFDPSRWESPTKDMKDAFFAFGGGSRVCLGMHLARMELRLATAQFFRNFPDARVSTREGMSDEDMETKIHFLLSPKGKRCLIEAR